MIEIAGAFNASALETLVTIPSHACGPGFRSAGVLRGPRYTSWIGASTNARGAITLAGGGVVTSRRSPGVMAPTNSRKGMPGWRAESQHLDVSSLNSRPARCFGERNRAGRFFE